jgi:RND family efflux transporter MFP subunit
MSRKTTLLKIIVPLIIILAGFGLMKVLIASRTEPKKEIRKDPGVIVKVMEAQKKDTAVIVRGTGTAEAAEEISIIPQVSGMVVYAAPNLNVGGFFRTGDILFEIEDTDYRLALDRARSARAKAEYELATIESQARIARAEWERINIDSDAPPNPLVLYEPQLKSARADLASAIATIEQARLDLERTKVKAPFNARVRSEDIDTGQYVKAGTSVAVLAGTDSAEVSVPLTLEDLSWLSVPRHGERRNGASASVHITVGSRRYEWKGRVVRSTGEVDPRSRMMQLVIEIKDPYGLKEQSHPPYPPLAAGTFVEVSIEGKMLEDIFIIPRAAFRDNSTVWIMDNDLRLHIRKVVPLRVEQETVIISEGLDSGERIILTSISGAADGMKLREMKENKRGMNF